MKTKPSYTIGDTVSLNGKHLLVTGVDLCQRELQYSLNGCSWYSHDGLEFISGATPQSVAEAIDIDADDYCDADESDIY